MPSVTLVCLVGAVFVFLLVVSLFSKRGKRDDEKRRRLENAAPAAAEPKRAQRKTLKMVAGDMRERQLKRARNAKSANPDQEEKKSPIQKQLDLLDVPLTSLTFLLIRLACAILLACVAGVVCVVVRIESRIALLAALCAAIVGLVIPSTVLGRLAKARQDQLRRDLPDIMDLLVVSVEAGLGFDAAIMRVYESNKSPLTEVLVSAIRDVQHGVSRKEAYEAIAKKCDVKELTSFTNALLQAEQLGISVTSVLNAQAELLREGRRRAAEERALKAPVTMMIPMVMFIFPVILIVLLGPAAMNLMETFS